MLIQHKLEAHKPTISFEIFPPKPDSPLSGIYQTIDRLADLEPEFISVTYGAGGSTQANTLDISAHIRNTHQLTSMAHLTCLTTSRDEMESIFATMKAKGIQNVLALRGDYPQGSGPADFAERDYQYAADLIAHLRSVAGDAITIGAACYPEKHQEAPDLVTDLRNLKAKVDAGADFLITQLFFDNELFYEFKEKADLIGIRVPIIAGIMPVLNKNQVSRIVELAGCSLPPKFRRIMDKYEHQPEALKEAGIAYAIEQIIDLLSSGVDGIHIYSMNKPDTVRDMLQRISTIRGVLQNGR